MNQKTMKFCLTSDGDGVEVEIEGEAQELTNLLASVISESEEVEMVVTMALLAVYLQNKKAEEDNDGAFLSELMMNMKPKAQA